MLLCLFVFLVLGEGWGKGISCEVGALSVAREGRVPLLLVLLAVFARAYVDVAAKITLDRRVSAAKTRETREEDPIYSYTTDIYFGEGTQRPTPGSAAP